MGLQRRNVAGTCDNMRAALPECRRFLFIRFFVYFFVFFMVACFITDLLCRGHHSFTAVPKSQTYVVVLYCGHNSMVFSLRKSMLSGTGMRALHASNAAFVLKSVAYAHWSARIFNFRRWPIAEAIFPNAWPSSLYASRTVHDAAMQCMRFCIVYFSFSFLLFHSIRIASSHADAHFSY